MPDRDIADFGRGQSVADAFKGTRIPRELRDAPNSHYLPGAGEGTSDFAAPIQFEPLVPCLLNPIHLAECSIRAAPN